MPDIQPLPPSHPDQPSPNSAADLIRGKLDTIYAAEPDAATELAEAESVQRRSRHQQFMHQLSTSGKDLATIQTEWHNYYVQLNDQDKHQVWQEFYSTSATAGPLAMQPSAGNNGNNGQPMAPAPSAAATRPAQALAEHKQAARNTPRFKTKQARAARQPRDLRSPRAIRAAIRDHVTAGGKLTPKHHLQSLLFGLGVGAIAIFIFLFPFFNEVIIAPFIQPSRASAATPVILDAATVPPSPDPQVIIPKINVQIPTDYSQTTTDEATIETALESGIVHYPTTALPGTQGNAAYFGHSSNNIFNKGKYKFAFVLLHLMVPGDTFYLSYNNKLYVYKVITKTVVEPSQVEVLNAVPGHTSTATLITCDPPGTSLKRLVVVGEQISPDPSGNVVSTASSSATLGQASVKLPGNGPTLGGKVLRSGLGKTIGTIVILGAIVYVLRWVNKPRRQP